MSSHSGQKISKNSTTYQPPVSSATSPAPPEPSNYLDKLPINSKFSATYPEDAHALEKADAKQLLDTHRDELESLIKQIEAEDARLSELRGSLDQNDDIQSQAALDDYNANVVKFNEIVEKKQALVDECKEATMLFNIEVGSYNQKYAR